MLDLCINKAAMQRKFKRYLFIKKNVASFIKSSFTQRAVEHVEYMKNQLCTQRFCFAKLLQLLAVNSLPDFYLESFEVKKLKNLNDEASKFLVFDFRIEANHAICSLLIYSFATLEFKKRCHLIIRNTLLIKGKMPFR